MDVCIHLTWLDVTWIEFSHHFRLAFISVFEILYLDILRNTTFSSFGTTSSLPSSNDTKPLIRLFPMENPISINVLVGFQIPFLLPRFLSPGSYQFYFTNCHTLSKAFSSGQLFYTILPRPILRRTQIYPRQDTSCQSTYYSDTAPVGLFTTAT